MWTLLEKMPDTALALILTGGLWFGFNYAVLAERAMAKDANENTLPSCIDALHQYESSLLNRTPKITLPGLGAWLNLPELDVLLDQAQQNLTPKLLTDAQKLARCQCAIASNSNGLRMDYAIHTASFRIIETEKATGLRSKAMKTVFSGECGSLPRSIQN